MHTALHTSACDLLGCQYPVILAGMGGVARAELVTAVSEAGGYGFLGMVREPAEFIRAQIRAVRERTSREFGVNLIPAATASPLLEEQVSVCLTEHVNAICLFWDIPPELVARFRRDGIAVVAQVGSAAEAESAVAAGVQMIIAQGVGAGGHVRGLAGWRELLPDMASRCDVPIVVAGGIADGAGLAEAISLGADGVMLGTAFLATHESFAHPYHKQRIVDGRKDETVHTLSFHRNWPPGAPVRVLANSVTQGERGDPGRETPVQIGREEERPIFLFSTDSPLRTTTGDLEAMAIYAGEGVEKIDRIVYVNQRMASIIEQASRILSVAGCGRAVAHERTACAERARGDADADMDGVPREEVLHLLNNCLEVKRGSARVTIRLATALREKGARKAVRRIYREDAEACQNLLAGIVELGGTPSWEAGRLYDKAASSDDVFERLASVQQGQELIIRQARQMLPRIRNANVYACLENLLQRQVFGLDAIYRLSCTEILE